MNIDKVIFCANKSMNERLGLKELAKVGPDHQGSSSRCPPLGDAVKINFDGAMSSSSRTIGLGVVIHDCDGALLVAIDSSSPLISPLASECQVARAGMEATHALGEKSIISEGDSL